MNRSRLISLIVLALLLSGAGSRLALPADTEERPERPEEYSLDDVVIWIEDNLPVWIPELDGNIHGRKRLTIKGTTGEVHMRICTTKGDTLRSVPRHLTDKELVTLLNEFYRIRFFEARASYIGGEAVALKRGTREVGPAVVMIADSSRDRLCIRIGDYKRCVEMDWGFAPKEYALLARRLWDLRHPE